MSVRNRKRKESNKAYRAAGTIYWTNEMERIIRHIRFMRRLFMWIAIGEPCVVAVIWGIWRIVT